MPAGCSVKPRELAPGITLLSVSLNVCRLCEASSRGSPGFSRLLSHPPSCCILDQSHLIRALFLFSCRTAISRTFVLKTPLSLPPSRFSGGKSCKGAVTLRTAQRPYIASTKSLPSPHIKRSSCIAES